eukprot:TRINITY_DN14754_c0_g1_i1.p1 TRINITY_DN14754_c0_g1~~TRINITY_DN14754_c0_g1_i1.p1  ORF type:complete len:357 (+),score=45.73 TRINITY_DN14754_c0_g1_i1:51-1121(+)
MRSATIIVLCLVAIVCGVTFAVDIPVTSISYTGRVQLTNDGRYAMFDWSGIQITAAFVGTSISAIFNDSTGNQYNALIDGKFVTIINTTIANKEYLIASGLSHTHHTVVLQKRTEALFGVAHFGGFNYQSLTKPKSSIQNSNQLKPRTIEFIGDSITCGFGILGHYPCGFSASTEDVALSYSYLVSQHFSASLHVESWSGKGLVRNYGDHHTTSLDPFPVYYPRTLANDPHSSWNFTQFTPDAVVINLGTNDYSTQPAPPQTVYEKGYHTFLDFIWGKYGRQTPMFLVCGPMIGNPCCQYVQNVVASYNGKGVYYVNLQGIMTPADYGCDGHPNTLGHSKMAALTIPVIGKHMNWS